MLKSRGSIEHQLVDAQVAINNALTDESLQTALAAFGYTSERLQEGKALRDTAWALCQQQKIAYGELFTARDGLKKAHRQAQERYMQCIKVARVALRYDRGAAQKLDLMVQRRRIQAEWIAQAQQFYGNALADPEVLAKLASFGITQELLEQGAQLVDKVDTHYAAQQQRKGTAQDATSARDNALDALNFWMRDFRAIMRVALKDRPQLLEKLGVLVRS